MAQKESVLSKELDLERGKATLHLIGVGQNGRTLAAHFAVEGAKLKEANRVLLTIVCENDGRYRANVCGITAAEDGTELDRHPHSHTTVLQTGGRFRPNTLAKMLESSGLRYLGSILQKYETDYLAI